MKDTRGNEVNILLKNSPIITVNYGNTIRVLCRINKSYAYSDGIRFHNIYY